MENLSKRRAVRVLRIIMPIVAIIITIIVAPLDLVPPWIAPLPNTVQAQVDDAVNQGLGMALLSMSIKLGNHQHFILLAGKMK